MQNKPNFSRDDMNVTTLLTNNYENFRLCCLAKNKAKQSQFKPNFSSKLALFFTNVGREILIKTIMCRIRSGL